MDLIHKVYVPIVGVEESKAMRDSQSQSYKEAGVNIEAGYEVVARIQKHIKNTMGERNSFDHLGFGGLLPLNVSGMSQPLLVSATDGVGTKLKLAFY